MIERNTTGDSTVATATFRDLILLAPHSCSGLLIRFFNRINNNLIIHSTDELGKLDALTQEFGDNARLMAFSTPHVVPGEFLSRLRYGAYNFHPGPPAYPGWAPSSFALYHGASMFGATAHVMTERVDAGPIVGTELFAIAPHISPDALAAQAARAMGRLLQRLGGAIAEQAHPLTELPLSWGDRRGTKAAYARLSQITPDLDPEEKARRLRAFNRADFLYSVPLGKRSAGTSAG